MGKAGKALKQVLDIYGITQNRLAVTMGVNRSTISLWYHESRDPAAEAVLEIIAGLEKINPAAAQDFLALYLGRFYEKEN